MKEIAGKIKTTGGNPLVVTMDINKPEDVSRLADTAVKRFGNIDVWINMAEVGVKGRFLEIPDQNSASRTSYSRFCIQTNGAGQGETTECANVSRKKRKCAARQKNKMFHGLNQ